MRKLNIGAGNQPFPKKDGWINIDAIEWNSNIDLILDLEESLLPYEDDTVDEIHMADFLEHLSGARQNPFLSDCFRVMKQGAKIFIQVPDMGVLAKRYCGVLENPTELQHDLTGEQLATMSFGGQDYQYNFHKWGYDTEYLTSKLISIGFSVWYARSDGGMNFHCQAAKPFRKLIIPIGGGIGDMLQVYMADPESHKAYEENNRPRSDSEFPTSNVTVSMWLRRLSHLKDLYPDTYIKVIISSTFGAARELFDNHPMVDEIELADPYEKRNTGYWYNYEKDDFRYIGRAEFIVENFDNDPFAFYPSSDSRKLIDAVKGLSPYVVIHTSAGIPERKVFSLKQYQDIALDVVEKTGYNVILLGQKENYIDTLSKNCGVYSLINQADVIASAEITRNAIAFIGTHSCFCLCAWQKEIPSVCIVPPIHDSGKNWADFMLDDLNPTTWGFRRAFNKTVIVDDPDGFDISEIAKLLPEVSDVI